MTKQLPTQPRIRIGIDPAFRKDGFCVCVIDENKEAQFKTFKNGYLDFMGWLLHDSPDAALVTVENSNLQKVTFNAKSYAGMLSKLGRFSWAPVMSILNRLAKHSRDVGKNQAISQITVDSCLAKWGKGSVQSISPRQKGKKWTKTEFKAVVQSEGHTLYGYTGSQDQRDAYQLALHRSFTFA